jgi:Protease inhibitor Inh
MNMMRVALIAAVAVCTAGGALAQTPPAVSSPAIGESARKLVGSWEFSNADRDKKCTATFSADRSTVGFKVEFDQSCAAQFPLVTDVAGWNFPDNDLLHLLDAQGKVLVEFSEVEDGIYEAPTPGVGVLFLQNAAAAAGPPPKPPAEVAGNWLLTRGAGTALCAFTLATTALGDGMALTIKPGCAGSIAQLNFTRWQLTGGELLLIPARGNPWRFEEVDTMTWRRISEGTSQFSLVRQP